MKQTISELVPAGSKAYVRFESEETCRAFLRQAEEEGFTFSDGTKPTRKHPSDLLAVHGDKTICYLGAVGRIACASGAKTVGEKTLVRLKF